MKATRIIISAFALLFCLGNAMAQEDYNKAQKAPKAKEVVLSKDVQTKNGFYTSPQAAYKAALREAQQEFPKKCVGIRNLTKDKLYVNGDGSVSYYYTYTVVELPSAAIQKLIEATNKATREIDEGCRFAIDKVTILDDITDKESTKSNLVELLMDKGYKVVAKEKLEKLYDEQQSQQSGIYNEKTKVKGNNFSAVGYFISVRITDEYVQVQVVNVSTGEFEGNVTVNL